jgi:hypothetical protein
VRVRLDGSAFTAVIACDPATTTVGHVVARTTAILKVCLCAADPLPVTMSI